MRIVAIDHLSLDGVMQAPGRADEDARDGFGHGGWASEAMNAPDQAIGAAMGARMAASDGLLLGRRTYDDLLASWNARGGPFKDALNDAPKYVASTRPSDPPPWPNTTWLGPDVPVEVRALRSRRGRELHVLGSGRLMATLIEHRLVDEYLLIIHPIVLGSGRRLFPTGTASILELVDAVTTAGGAIVATYRTSAG